MKRIVSVILALCLMMALPVGAYAATSYPGGLSLDKTSVEVGEEVVLTMSLPADALATIQFGIVFPVEFLEITSISAPAEGEKGVGLYAASDMAAANENGCITFAFVGDQGDNAIAAEDGLITITFKALAASDAVPISFAGDEVMPWIMDTLDGNGEIADEFEPTDASVTLKITEPAYVLGDVTGDGRINMADVTAIRKYIINASLYPLAVQAAGDVTGDGRINMADVTAIRKYIINPTLYPLG